MSATADRTSGPRASAVHVERVGELVRRAAADLAMIIERDVRVHSCSVERAKERAGGAAGTVHIAIKQAYALGERASQGCVLVPLADALSLAGLFLMLPDEVVESQRASANVDGVTKDALLEVASFIASSLMTGLGGSASKIEVRSASCQGVRAGSLPALTQEPGGEWWVARASVQIHSFPASEFVWMFPSVVDDAL